MALTMSIDFAANIARLEENTRKAAGAVESMANRIESASGFIKRAAAGMAGAFSVGAFAAAIKGSIDLADNLNDLSKRTGASVEMLSGFRLAAAQSGTSLEAVANGSRKLATSMTENKDVFQKLGIDTGNQTRAMIQLGDVFAGMDDPVQRSALAVKIFGKAGDEMLPMLMEGSAGIERMVKRGQELSPVTKELSAQADQFNDGLAELRMASEGVFVVFARSLLPVFNKTVAGLGSVAKQGDIVTAVGDGLAVAFETVVVLGAEVGYAFVSIGRELGGMAAQIAALASGDWEGFKAIGREMKTDAAAARKEVDAFTASVLSARQRAKEAAKDAANDDKPNGNKDNRGNNLLAGLAGASDEAAKLREKDIAGWVKYADAILEEGERIEAIERERIIKLNDLETARELAWQQGVAMRLAKIQEAGMTEEELERGKLIAIQNDLEAAYSMGWLTEESYRQMREQAQLEHEARLGNIVAQGHLARQRFVQMSAMQQTNFVLAEMLRMTQGVATQNRAMFEINRVAGIAQAGINLWEGTSRTWNAYPFPWNIPMTALHVAAGLAHIDGISSAQFGSSTSAPSVGGGAAIPVTQVGGAAAVPINSAPQVQAAATQINMTFQGNGKFSAEEIVDGILPALEDALGNGAGRGVINVSFA